MKVSAECYQCLQRLVYQAAELATSDERLKSLAIAEGLKVVEGWFSYDKLSITIATEIHRVIREVTQNSDPYKAMKEEEIKVSRELYSRLRNQYGQDLRGCLTLSLLGNSIDFFRDIERVREEMAKPIQFAKDDTDKLEGKLKEAKRILYLADNTGEVFFDLPLVKYMEGFALVIYVVKASPVQDDVTLEDLKEMGLEGEFSRVITTGTATPGVDLALASAEFKRELASADLILAKGMGYYESLTELPAEGKVFYGFMAKCQPVANSAGVPLNSYVAMLC